ncbi:MAG: hypothetical protein SFV22_10795 [Saprospiraceae bacterium]|nr:hypothetical protein [Saprospiraceae bacterium]
MKKVQFLLLTMMLLFARGCDFYSTSLWFFEHPEGEMNPLARFLGFGWNGLIVANIIVVAFIVYACYFYYFKHVVAITAERPVRLTDYISEIYFQEKGKFYQILYKSPKNGKILLGHLGYVLIRVAIFGSILATIHNLCQFYQVAAYDTFREIVGRPLFVIYGLILLSLIYYSFRIWRKEFEHARRQLAYH